MREGERGEGGKAGEEAGDRGGSQRTFAFTFKIKNTVAAASLAIVEGSCLNTTIIIRIVSTSANCARPADITNTLYTQPRAVIHTDIIITFGPWLADWQHWKL